VEWRDMDWIDLVQNRDKLQDVVNKSSRSGIERY
jgi:hypothetical protein